MRRQLAIVSLSVALLVVLAFLIPLGALLQRTARERALDQARTDVAALVPAVIASGDDALLMSAIESTTSGRSGLITVLRADGTRLGRTLDGDSAIDLALTDARSLTGEVPDGSGDVEIIRVVRDANGSIVAIRGLVPSDELVRGVRTAWLAMAGVGVALTGVAVFASDRLAIGVVQSTKRLSSAALRLGAGDLTARVEPEGPPELQDLATTFNDLGGQVEGMLERERALVADMSHRLRTPLTRLRLRLDLVDDPALAAELRMDLDATTNALTGLIGAARASIDRRGPGVTACDACNIVATRGAFWQILATEQQREMDIHYEPDALLVPVAPAALEEIVDILIDNVFSHTSAGAAFEIGVSRQARQARIWIDDAGKRESGPRPTGPSSGLGLKIVAQQAAAVGGEVVHPTSRLGGFCIAVDLPTL